MSWRKAVQKIEEDMGCAAETAAENRVTYRELLRRLVVSQELLNRNTADLLEITKKMYALQIRQEDRETEEAERRGRDG